MEEAAVEAQEGVEAPLVADGVEAEGEQVGEQGGVESVEQIPDLIVTRNLADAEERVAVGAGGLLVHTGAGSRGRRGTGRRTWRGRRQRHRRRRSACWSRSGDRAGRRRLVGSGPGESSTGNWKQRAHFMFESGVRKVKPPETGPLLPASAAAREIEKGQTEQLLIRSGQRSLGLTAPPKGTMKSLARAALDEIVCQ